MKMVDKKIVYFLVICISLVLLITGATYAYFSAKVSDNDTVKGVSEVASFSLTVEKVETEGMELGLIPMKNEDAPIAANMKCYDSSKKAVCQLYKITVESDSETATMLDGYIVIKHDEERLDVRYTRVYTGDEKSFNTSFTKDDFASSSFNVATYIKDGACTEVEQFSLKADENANCLLVSGEEIGGESTKKIFYVMLWVYDNGEAQDYLQGLVNAYQGEVILMVSGGNEIKATFD